MKFRKTLEFTSYMIIGVTWLMILSYFPNKILFFIRDVIMCFGISLIIKEIFNEIEWLIEKRNFHQEIQKQIDSMKLDYITKENK